MSTACTTEEVSAPSLNNANFRKSKKSFGLRKYVRFALQIYSSAKIKSVCFKYHKIGRHHYEWSETFRSLMVSQSNTIGNLVRKL